MRDDKLAMFGGRRSEHNYGLRKKRTMLGSAGSVRVHSLARGCWRGTAGVEAAEENVRTLMLGLSTWRDKVGKVGRVRIRCGAARVKVCIMC